MKELVLTIMVSLCVSNFLERTAKTTKATGGQRLQDVITQNLVTEYVDGPPGQYQEQIQGVTLHACPKGFAMGGAHVGFNKFTCRRVLKAGHESTVHDVLDSGTQRNGMHVCPSGSYMRGFHESYNQLLCSTDNGPNVVGEFTDDRGKTQGNDMHICPQRDHGSSVMTGIHVSDNNFSCAIKPW